MRSPLAIASALFIAAVVLVGCSPTPGPSPSDSESSPSASPSEEASEPVPATLIVSLDSVTLLNDDDSVVGSAQYSDGQGVLELVSLAFGSTPEGVANTDGYPITSYDWGTVLVSVVTDGWAWLSVGASEYAGIAIHTTDGITVGDSRAEVEPLATYDSGSDFDGDGKSDNLGVEASENPDVESLEHPGEPGTDFVMIVFDADVVTRINSPSSDYGDL